jgi:hypothetical protein
VGIVSISRGNNIILFDSLGYKLYLNRDKITSSLSIFILLSANSRIGFFSFLSNFLDVVTPKTIKDYLKELALKLSSKIMKCI